MLVKHTLLASSAQTATFNTSTVTDLKWANGEANLYINVASSSGTNETLDIIVQVSPDNSTWYAHTTVSQITGAGQTLVKLTANLGRYLRCNCTIGGTDTPTFTFGLELETKQDVQ